MWSLICGIQGDHESLILFCIFAKWTYQTLLFFVRLHILKPREHLFVCMWWTEEGKERVQVGLISSFMFPLRQKRAVKNKKSLKT